VWRVALFAAVMQAGVMSHGIFATVPLSLAVCLVVLLIRRPDSPLVPLLRLTLVCLAASAVALATGMAMSPEGWQRYRTVCTAGDALLPIVSMAVFKATSGQDARIRYWCGRTAASAATMRTLGGLVATGLLAFAALNLVGLIQVLSGVAIVERVVSWMPPPWLRIPLYAAAIGALGVAVGRAARSTRVARGFSESDRVLAFWPVALMAIFVLVRPVAAIRHFSILIFLLMLSLAAALPLLVARRRALIVVGGALVLAIQVCLWREILVPHVRRPIDFHVGWGAETSRHFQSLALLRGTMDRDGICRWHANDFFLNEPLAFDLAVRPVACRSSQVLEVDDCIDCTAAPFARWKLR